MNLTRKRQPGETNENLDKTANQYFERFRKDTPEKRRGAATTLVNEYYDLVTDFYEYGWGDKFHFAPRFYSESFEESLTRHEHFIASRGGFKKGDRVLDIGCGIGGPARAIVSLTRCNVLGVNNNEYQIQRARHIDKKLGFSENLDYCKSDFCHMPLPDNSLDGAYAIEATCHAANKHECYGEVFRVLAPGAYFVLYEWCTTDRYDPNNKEHRRIKDGIEIGDGLPDMESTHKALEAMRDVGFIVDEAYDIFEEMEKSPFKQLPWYLPLQSSYSSIKGLRATPIGRFCTNMLCRVLEFFNLASKGAHNAAVILEEAADNLVKGGQEKIFTPGYYMRGRKPL